jgi:hypothetical protein
MVVWHPSHVCSMNNQMMTCGASSVVKSVDLILQRYLCYRRGDAVGGLSKLALKLQTKGNRVGLEREQAPHLAAVSRL